VSCANCIICGNNAANNGGGIYIESYGAFANCTIVGNSATNQGGGVYEDAGNGQTAILNTIIYFNSTPATYQNYMVSGVNDLIAYSCSIPLLSGTGNITNDPQFADYAGGDFHLAPSSPCIDTGTNMTWMVSATDIRGDPRIVNGRVDIGAYEYQGLWDLSVNLGSGWRWSDWFGYFSTTYDPWIYHLQHGWMYSVGTAPSSIWLWTLDMGWLWTSSTTYPYLYRNNDGAWLYYLEGSASPRWFYNFKTSAWESR